MPDTIIDGQGGGNQAGVTEENRLKTDTISETLAHHVNKHESDYYTLTISQQATAADDCIGYIKNTDDKDLHINSVYLYSTAATLLTIKLSDEGTPDTPTTLTPVNCHAGSNKTASGTFNQGAELDKSSALRSGSTALNWYQDSATSGHGELLDFYPMLIIPKNSTCTFYVNQNSAAVVVGLGMFYH